MISSYVIARSGSAEAIYIDCRVGVPPRNDGEKNV